MNTFFTIEDFYNVKMLVNGSYSKDRPEEPILITQYQAHKFEYGLEFIDEITSKASIESARIAYSTFAENKDYSEVSASRNYKFNPVKAIKTMFRLNPKKIL